MFCVQDWRRARCPCCGRYYHKDCLQKFAYSSGEQHFKCAACNDAKKMSKMAREVGVYLPHKDADWELPEHASFYNFADHYNPKRSCDVAVCQNGAGTEGRRRNDVDGEFEIVACTMCGNNSAHTKCGNIDPVSLQFTCGDCQPVEVGQSSMEDSQNESVSIEELLDSSSESLNESVSIVEEQVTNKGLKRGPQPRSAGELKVLEMKARFELEEIKRREDIERSRDAFLKSLIMKRKAESLAGDTKPSAAASSSQPWHLALKSLSQPNSIRVLSMDQINALASPPRPDSSARTAPEEQDVLVNEEEVEIEAEASEGEDFSTEISKHKRDFANYLLQKEEKKQTADDHYMKTWKLAVAKELGIDEVEQIQNELDSRQKELDELVTLEEIQKKEETDRKKKLAETVADLSKAEGQLDDQTSFVATATEAEPAAAADDSIDDLLDSPVKAPVTAAETEAPVELSDSFLVLAEEVMEALYQPEFEPVKNTSVHKLGPRSKTRLNVEEEVIKVEEKREETVENPKESVDEAKLITKKDEAEEEESQVKYRPGPKSRKKFLIVKEIDNSVQSPKRKNEDPISVAKRQKTNNEPSEIQAIENEKIKKDTDASAESVDEIRKFIEETSPAIEPTPAPSSEAAPAPTTSSTPAPTTAPTLLQSVAVDSAARRRRKRRFQCPVCEGFFSTEITLGQHLAKIHFWNRLLELPVEVPGASPGTTPIYHCNQSNCQIASNLYTHTVPFTYNARNVVAGHIATYHKQVVFDIARSLFPSFSLPAPEVIDLEDDEPTNPGTKRAASPTRGLGAVEKRSRLGPAGPGDNLRYIVGRQPQYTVLESPPPSPPQLVLSAPLPAHMEAPLPAPMQAPLPAHMPVPHLTTFLNQGFAPIARPGTFWNTFDESNSKLLTF